MSTLQFTLCSVCKQIKVHAMKPTGLCKMQKIYSQLCIGQYATTSIGQFFGIAAFMQCHILLISTQNKMSVSVCVHTCALTSDELLSAKKPISSCALTNTLTV